MIIVVCIDVEKNISKIAYLHPVIYLVVVIIEHI